MALTDTNAMRTFCKLCAALSMCIRYGHFCGYFAIPFTIALLLLRFSKYYNYRILLTSRYILRNGDCTINKIKIDDCRIYDSLLTDVIRFFILLFVRDGNDGATSSLRCSPKLPSKWEKCAHNDFIYFVFQHNNFNNFLWDRFCVLSSMFFNYPVAFISNYVHCSCLLQKPTTNAMSDTCVPSTDRNGDTKPKRRP